jgi:hypothetical protein
MMVHNSTRFSYPKLIVSRVTSYGLEPPAAAHADSRDPLGAFWLASVGANLVVDAMLVFFLFVVLKT